jgi:hypothetical protein
MKLERLPAQRAFASLFPCNIGAARVRCRQSVIDFNRSGFLSPLHEAERLDSDHQI